MNTISSKQRIANGLRVTADSGIYHVVHAYLWLEARGDVRDGWDVLVVRRTNRGEHLEWGNRYSTQREALDAIHRS